MNQRLLSSSELALFRQQFCATQGNAPFPWQERLFQDFCRGDLPSALDLPTGLGKTSVMAIWYLALEGGAPVPRRLVYVVDRRAVVDQATTVAEKIRESSGDAALRIARSAANTPTIVSGLLTRQLQPSSSAQSA